MTRPTFLDDIRRIGAIGWLAYACDRALSSVFAGRVRFTALWFYAQPVDRIPTIEPRASDRMQIRVIAHDEIPEEAFGRPPGAVSERFAHGGVCIAALKDSELAGFMWLQFDELRERLVRCDFVPRPHGKACWDFDFFVAPQYRLGRTFGRLWSHAKAYLGARGVETTLSWIAFDNAASQRAHERMGAKPVGWALVLTAWKLQLVLTSARPHVSLGLSDTHRTRLMIEAR
ncbi:MAG: GNAT family N-acetyltransferase [Burkholderiaceae bacterium]